ncbi:MAG: quinone-dependent dihydroorotate dehydrogenase [Pseudomonadota bacterium]
MLSFIVGWRNRILRLLYLGVAKPLIFLWEPEEAHANLKVVGKFLGSNAITRKLTAILFYYAHPALETTVDGVSYPNPVGLSAGFDKDGELTSIYPELGFGLAELGSFTGEITAGNPGKRLFRMKKSKSILVWYGLNNQGAEAISKRLAKADFRIPIGISAAKSNITEDFVLQDSIDDYMKTYTAFADIGHYTTINISCPNTQDGEPFADKDNLRALCDAVRENYIPNKPVYVKLAADLTRQELEDTLDVVMENKDIINGVVLTNLAKPAGEGGKEIKGDLAYHKGGMSGLPVQRLATQMIRDTYRYTGGEITIIGVGGIFTARDAYEKITSGANLLHLITAMIFDGPQSMGEINRGIVKMLKKDGFKTLAEAVGSKNPLPAVPGYVAKQRARDAAQVIKVAAE